MDYPRVNSRLHAVIWFFVAGLCCVWTLAAEAQTAGWVERASTGPSTAATDNRATEPTDHSEEAGWLSSPLGKLKRPTWSPTRNPITVSNPRANSPESPCSSDRSKGEQDATYQRPSQDAIYRNPFRDSYSSRNVDGSEGRPKYNLAQRNFESDANLHYEYSPPTQPNLGECDAVQDIGCGANSYSYSPECFQIGGYNLPTNTWVWGRAEYLLWWTKGNNVPPLVTTSPDGTPQLDAGVLGLPETSILFGNRGLNTDIRSGGRFSIGCWLLPTQEIGFEGSYLFLGPSVSRYEAASMGSPILARPFLNIENGLQEAHLLAFPNWVQGAISAKTTNSFQALNGLFRVMSFRRENGQLELLAGYRFCRLDDNLRIDESLQAAGPASITLFDSFNTRNEFHGADLGVAGRYVYDRWSLDTLIKIAFGNSQSRVIIDGATETIVGGSSSSSPGGFLAQPTNMGTYEHNEFAMVPEVGLTLGYEILPNLRATFGYTLIYWSKVARPGDQIDTELNLSQLPPGPLVGPAKPEFRYATNDFWAHGMNFGVEYRY